MPIYEYDCPTCGRFEIIQKSDERALKECPTCKANGRKNRVTKVLSPAAFHLKGSGWYKTDYASSKGPTSSEAGKGSDAQSNASPAQNGAGSESKKEDAKAKNKSCGSACTCH